MIKVNYDAETGEVKGFYPDNISYASIPEPYVEIDESTHQDCINHQGLRKVDLATQKIVEYVPEIVEPTKEEKLVALDAVYQSQFTALAQSLGLASLDANAAVIDGVKADYAALKAEYQAKVKEIG